MNLEKQIREWFREDGSFMAGTGLLMQTGANTSYFQQHFSGSYVPDDVDQGLKCQLTAYLESLPMTEFLTDVRNSVITEITEKQTSTLPRLADAGENNPAAAPSITAAEPHEIKKLREQAKMLHKEQAYCHAQMSTGQTDEYRLEFAQKIMVDIIPALDAKYDAIRSWKDTGEVPGQASQNDGFKRGVEMMRRQASLKSRVSRLKGFLKKELDAKERAGFEKELLEKETELEEIEGQIN